MSEKTEHLRDFNYYKFSQRVNQKNVLVEYIWIDGTGESMRSKTKVYQEKVTKLEDLEWWTYDGSSTEQAVTNDSEIYLKPVCMVSDPFRGEPHLLVLCETYLRDKKTPARFNFRYIADEILKKSEAHKPWFGIIEQEYFLLKRTGTTHFWPLGWPNGGFPHPQGRYYCSIGERNCFGRAVTEAHLRACLNAEIKIAGVNAEGAPSQQEFQIGICQGIEAGDHLWLARYILERIGEEFGVDITYDPKPIPGDWLGSETHCNYSTEQSRADGGYDYIVQKMLPLLDQFNKDILQLYWSVNDKRVASLHETSPYNQFSWGDGSRTAAIRVPITVKELGQGYIEDRRPAAHIDPYIMTAALVDVTCDGGQHIEQLKKIIKQAEQPLIVHK